jgi:hypothetical protein
MDLFWRSAVEVAIQQHKIVIRAVRIIRYIAGPPRLNPSAAACPALLDAGLHSERCQPRQPAVQWTEQCINDATALHARERGCAPAHKSCDNPAAHAQH